MFNVEESLNHLENLRRKVILMKGGKSEEGITPLPQKQEEKVMVDKNKQKELNA